MAPKVTDAAALMNVCFDIVAGPIFGWLIRLAAR
jgi:hypothetical protein